MHETFGAIRSQNFISIICSQRSHYSGQSIAPAAAATTTAAANMWHNSVAHTHPLCVCMQISMPKYNRGMERNNHMYLLRLSMHRAQRISLDVSSVPQNCNKIFQPIHSALHWRECEHRFICTYGCLVVAIRVRWRRRRCSTIIFAIWMNECGYRYACHLYRLGYVDTNI